MPLPLILSSGAVTKIILRSWFSQPVFGSRALPSACTFWHKFTAQQPSLMTTTLMDAQEAQSSTMRRVSGSSAKSHQIDVRARHGKWLTSSTVKVDVGKTCIERIKTSDRYETSTIIKGSWSSKDKYPNCSSMSVVVHDTHPVVTEGPDHPQTHQLVPNPRSSSLVSVTSTVRSVILKVCGSPGHSEPTTSRLDISQAIRQSRKGKSRSGGTSSGHVLAANQNVRQFHQPERKLDQSGNSSHKLSGSSLRSKKVQGQAGVHEEVMIPAVEHLMASCGQGSDVPPQTHCSKPATENTNTQSAFVREKSLVKVEAICDLNSYSKTGSATNQLAELEDGEIIDRDVSDRVHGRGRKKRKHRDSITYSSDSVLTRVAKKSVNVSDHVHRRSRKKRKHRDSITYSSDSVLTRVAKKSVDKVEIVDLCEITANKCKHGRKDENCVFVSDRKLSTEGMSSVTTPGQFEVNNLRNCKTTSEVKHCDELQEAVTERPVLLRRSSVATGQVAVTERPVLLRRSSVATGQVAVTERPVLLRWSSVATGQVAVPERPVLLRRSSVATGQVELKVDQIQPSGAAFVVLEDGELLSEIDSSSNVKQVLSPSGSDMSISSESTEREEGTATIEYGDGQGLRASMPESSRITQNSCVSNVQTSATLSSHLFTLYPCTPSSVASSSVPAGDDSWAVNTSVTSMTATSARQSQTMYQPQPAGFVSSLAPTYRPPSSMLASTCDITHRSLSSITPYITAPQHHPHQLTDPYLLLPLLSLSDQRLCTGTSFHHTDSRWQQTDSSFHQTDSSFQHSCIQHTGCHTRPGQTDDLSAGTISMELSSQSSGSRIHLNLSGLQTCPELTDTPRHWHSIEQQQSGAGADALEFTVMSYNILAQELMDRHMYLYSRCREVDLDWVNRGPALLKQIIAHNADIVCLQEVQEENWAQDIRDVLAGHGYQGVYKKQAGDKPDGCAILFKSSKFNQLQVIPVEFLKGGILDRSNIGIILLLQPRREVYGGSTKKICVSTTHLLFNPRRGDVKLAQLSLLLAEIDKYAYLGEDVTDRARDGKVDSSDGADKGACHHHVACESFADIGKPELGPRERLTGLRPRYCPIILCGDFNSEPFSDLYKFVTTGYLRYEDLVARLVCGQEEGKWGGSDRAVGRRLMPAGLPISETCQYIPVLKERYKSGQGCWTSQLPNVNSGQLFHGMNFRSVYSHFVDPPGPRKREVSTHHNKCSCTVDYIFYSTSRVEQRQDRPTYDTKTGQHPDTQQQERETNTSTHIRDKHAEIASQPLQLVARYRLMTSQEVARYGFMPNSTLPSDHLCLIARFVLL